MRAVKDAAALSRALRREVRRAQRIAPLIEHGDDLLLAEGVVAERHDVRAGVEDVLRLTGQHAVSCGVLAVYDNEIRARVAFDAAQQRVQRVDAGLADNIADG